MEERLIQLIMERYNFNEEGARSFLADLLDGTAAEASEEFIAPEGTKTADINRLTQTAMEEAREATREGMLAGLEDWNQKTQTAKALGVDPDLYFTQNTQFPQLMGVLDRMVNRAEILRPSDQQKAMETIKNWFNVTYPTNPEEPDRSPEEDRLISNLSLQAYEEARKEGQLENLDAWLDRRMPLIIDDRATADQQKADKQGREDQARQSAFAKAERADSYFNTVRALGVYSEDPKKLSDIQLGFETFEDERVQLIAAGETPPDIQQWTVGKAVDWDSFLISLPRSNRRKEVEGDVVGQAHQAAVLGQRRAKEQLEEGRQAAQEGLARQASFDRRNVPVPEDQQRVFSDFLKETFQVGGEKLARFTSGKKDVLRLEFDQAQKKEDQRIADRRTELEEFASTPEGAAAQQKAFAPLLGRTDVSVGQVTGLTSEVDFSSFLKSRLGNLKEEEALANPPKRGVNLRGNPPGRLPVTFR